MVDAKLPTPISKAARNERRKAVATTCNAVSVALFVTAGLQPLMAGRYSMFSMIAAAGGFVAFQGVLHYILRQVED
jgi:hypothetical protein